MKRNILYLTLIVCLLAIASNPSKPEYVSFVKEELTKEGHPIIAMFSSPIFNNFTKKQNFGVFSLYETKVEDGESLIALGAFNRFYWIHTPK